MKKISLFICCIMVSLYMAAGNVYNLSYCNDGDKITLQDGDELTGSTSKHVKVMIAQSASVTLNNATINKSNLSSSGSYAGLTPLGTAYIYLKGVNKITSYGDTEPGLFLPKGSTVHIYEAEPGASLLVQSRGKGPGIGACFDYYSTGHLRIHSGTITAYGGDNSPGIGASHCASIGNITIDGGTVTSIAAKYYSDEQFSAAGIGTGQRGICGNITITGGTVTAMGADYGPGIGAGDCFNGTEFSCKSIQITGGSVTATGGTDAPAIGAGYLAHCGNITIGSGVTYLKAVKGSNAPCTIGKGNNGLCGSITIGGTGYPQGIFQSPYYYPLSAMPCGKPKDVTISNVTATSAKISWSAGYANTRYTVWYNRYLQDEGFNTPETTATSYTIKNLQPGTEYEVFLQAYCSECNKTSDYTSSMHFVTLGGQGIDEVQGDKVQRTKVLRDGKLLIIVGDKTYDARGVEVR